ncbi:MAG TPA: tetratricopeptide repeat protein, partial [Candidatus Krumholzibacteria bacterium]|nr:tetratricopeptide repeat protein [Candidatus Krumholzibacteria bacterium]
RIISHCLEKDPERRFQTAKDVRNELEGLRREVDSGEIVTPAGGISAADLAASERGRGSVRQSPRWMVIAAVVMGIAVVAVWLSMRGGSHAIPNLPDKPGTPATAGARKDRSMAVVLPFENLGPAEDAYFAAGVTEEITSRLASVSGLGVISRTSAENYEQKGKTMKQIGADLGVDYVLEGSVRWAKTADGKGRVRITPQLVRVTDDTPVWTDTYDREVKDIFDVQTDIATHVVDALGVTLQSSERQSLEERPTDNIEAYQLYVRAHADGCTTGECDVETVKLLEQAVALDPKFLAAWYRLSREHSFMYHINFDRSEERLARAKAALDHMEAIDANHPYTRMARGFYYYYGFRDYDRALTEFTAVADAQPNNADARFAVALIHRRRGEYDETLRGMQEAVALDPKNVQFIWDLADTYDSTRQPDLAREWYEKAWQVGKDPSTLGDMVASVVRYSGDLNEAEKLLMRVSDRSAPELINAWVVLYQEKRDYAACNALLGSQHSPYALMQAWFSAIAAITEAMQGSSKAKPALENAAKQMEETLHDQPSNYGYASMLGLVYAYLGRGDDAIRQAKLAMDLVAKDEYVAPQTMEALAIVYAHTGHADEAIDLIEHLLTMSYDDPLTVTTLRNHPFWDPLRDNPKFKEMLKRST